MFSITKITWQGESKSIEYGLLGNIFLSEKVNKAFNNNEITTMKTPQKQLILWLSV